MRNPKPIDELPSFIAQSKNTELPKSNPWLRYIIVGSIIMLSVTTAIALMSKNTPKINPKNKKENEDEFRNENPNESI